MFNQLTQNNKIAIIVAVIGALALVIGNLIISLGNKQTITPQPENSKVSPVGEFISPKDGEDVPSTIDVKLRLNNIPDDHSVWLVVQIGNHYWPKKPEIHGNHQEKSVQIFHNGKSGEHFKLNLIHVDKVGTAKIHAWFSEGERENNYPPFVGEIPGSSVLKIAEVVSQ